MALMAVACNPTEIEHPKVPVILIVIPDGIGSADDPLPLTETHIDQVISILSRYGGIAAFTLIHDKDSQPLIRLELTRTNGRLDERAKSYQRNRKAVTEWKSQIEAAVKRDRNGKMRNFNKLLSRLTLFWNEPTLPPNGTKVVLLIANERHVGGRKITEYVALPPEVTVFVVGLESALAKKIFGEGVFVFESVSAAVDGLAIIPNGKD